VLQKILVLSHATAAFFETLGSTCPTALNTCIFSCDALRSGTVVVPVFYVQSDMVISKPAGGGN
jgi:hypothetical protein